MQYVNLGKTGMKVSRLCFGMMSYGSKQWRKWILGEEEAKPLIKRALDASINFFDTADVYSTGESECITGKLLKKFGVRRENVIVADCVAEVAKERGVSGSQVARAWILSKAYVTSPIIGATKLDHLDQTIAALDIKLYEEEINQLEESYKPHPALEHS